MRRHYRQHIGFEDSPKYEGREDDVLSELDFSRKKSILSTISDIQTIITCTGISDIKNYLDSKSKVFNVKNGAVYN